MLSPCVRPKQLVRDNAKLLVLFKQDELNLYHVYKDGVNTDMKNDYFKVMFAEAWKHHYGCLIANNDASTGTEEVTTGSLFKMMFQKEKKHKRVNSIQKIHI